MSQQSQKNTASVPVNAGSSSGGWLTSLPPIAPGAVPVYGGANRGTLTLSGLKIFDDDTEVKPLNVNFGATKCDGIGCKEGKVLLLNKTVDCDKCKGTGTL